RGQAHAKRALEIAAAGAHNLLLVGPPGGGKTMLARRLAAILPPLSSDEVLEVSAIWSVAGLLPRPGALMTRRPFRAPHHTISVSGLIGGGGPPHPGEVTLAHLGVLFLDAVPGTARRSCARGSRMPVSASGSVSALPGSASTPRSRRGRSGATVSRRPRPSSCSPPL